MISTYTSMLKERYSLMPKRATPIKKTEIKLYQNAQASLYKQLYERLRAQILARQLEAGARLPSTRALADELGVSRNTITLAYELLQLEGYIESRVGDGTRVANLQPEHLLQVGTQHSTLNTQHLLERSDSQASVLSRRGQILVNAASSGDLYASQASAGMSPFRVGEPDVTHFPYETWARLVARHARRSLQAIALYQNVQGYAPLREAIAAHIGISRGVHCSPGQIILTAGSQGALDLVARVLLDPGDPAWVEDPGYFGARGAPLAAGARLVPVSVDQEGIDVEAGRQLCPEARLAIVTPSHQFPTGVTMSLGRLP